MGSDREHVIPSRDEGGAQAAAPTRASTDVQRTVLDSPVDALDAFSEPRTASGLLSPLGPHPWAFDGDIDSGQRARRCAGPRYDARHRVVRI
jgi:hypothetical protein